MPEKRVREYFLDKRGEIAKFDKVSIKPMYVRNINEDLGTLMVEVLDSYVSDPSVEQGCDYRIYILCHFNTGTIPLLGHK